MPPNHSLQPLSRSLRAAGNVPQVEKLVQAWLEERYGRGCVALDRSERRGGPLSHRPSRLREITSAMVLDGIHSHEASLLLNEHFVIEGSPGRLDQEDRELLDSVTQLFCEAFNRLWQAQNNDPLTGLPDLDSFHQQLASLLESERLLCLILLDLDRFGDFNATHGVARGDKTLSAVAQMLHDTIRPQDTVFRCLADEFAVLLPGTLIDSAAEIASRICENLQATELTASIGIASWPERSADKAELLKAAKDAMFAAWRLGGDRICLAPQIKA